MRCIQVEEGLLTGEEAEECLGIEFNPVRAGFHGGQDVWTRDVLNLGVRPDKAIAKVLHGAPRSPKCIARMAVLAVQRGAVLGTQLQHNISCA